MTEDYKINVLKQLTGQPTIEAGIDAPMFILTSDDTNTLEEYIIEQGYNSNHSFILKHTCTRNNQQLLFYNETQAGVFVSSFIVITDIELTPIGIVKSYKGGTAFREWEVFQDDDLGEGRIYFIDRSGNTYRVVYINDPTSKKVGDAYEVESLYNYTLAFDSYNIPRTMMKNPEAADFVISSYNSQTGIISLNLLKVNVGSPNEWIVYSYGTAEQGFSGDISMYPVWSDEISCRLCFVNVSNNLQIDVLNTSVDSDDNHILVLQRTITLPQQYQDYTNDIDSLVMRDYNYFYCCSQGLIADDPTCHFFEVNLNTGVMKSLYSTPEYTTWYIQCINSNIFFTRYSYDNNTFENTCYFGMVSKGEYYDIELFDFVSIDPRAFIINSFNLYSIRIIDGQGETDELKKLYVIYNPLNYNGAWFTDLNSVVSNSVVLNNESGQPIFARNLYNKTISQNTIESTIEIPAYQLNGINIAEQQLVSKNNNNIIYQYDNVEKNIYEVVLMNFFNTLSIIDNNENKNKLMTNASSYFVNGLENEGYENTKATKFRVTYTDSSVYTGTISELSIEDNVANISFAFYSGVGVSKLEIISNDELMTYATIDETFDPSSYYKVNQEVVIN